MKIPNEYKIATHQYQLIKEEPIKNNTKVKKIKALYKELGMSNYEVLIIRENLNLKSIINGKEVTFKPYKMPSNEDFGRYGWHYVTLSKAEDKYASIMTL